MKRIRDLTTRAGILCISPHETVQNAAAKLIKANVGALLVCNKHNIEGILTIKDIVQSCAIHPHKIPRLEVNSIMTKSLYTATMDDNLDEVINIMIKKGYRHVPITDQGKYVGMITPIDVLQFQKNLLDNERDDLIHYVQGLY
jgi:CBS domain-containing protein